MRRIGSLVVVAAGVLAACSGGPSAAEVLLRAGDSLGDIRSGELHLSVLVTTSGRGSSRIGFEIDGPFALAESGELPEADITYTQVAGEDELKVGLVSTGETAYQTVGGQTIEMSEPQLDALRATGGSSADGGFEQLGVSEWIDDAQLQDGGRRGGTDVYLVTGRLDVVAALKGMVDAATAFGASGAAGLEHLDAADERLIENAVRSSSVGVYAGEEDGLLRELSLLVEFQADAKRDVIDALGPLSGARLVVELSIDDPNDPVDVEAPPGVVEESSP